VHHKATHRRVRPVEQAGRIQPPTRHRTLLRPAHPAMSRLREEHQTMRA
jgi:hypothetical protein